MLFRERLAVPVLWWVLGVGFVLSLLLAIGVYLGPAWGIGAAAAGLREQRLLIGGVPLDDPPRVDLVGVDHRAEDGAQRSRHAARLVDVADVRELVGEQHAQPVVVVLEAAAFLRRGDEEVLIPVIVTPEASSPNVPDKQSPATQPLPQMEPQQGHRPDNRPNWQKWFDLFRPHQAP